MSSPLARVKMPLPYVSSGFFAFRTPLLSFDAFLEWGRSLAAPGQREGHREDALAEDRRALRGRLREWCADPLVREALFIASPSLCESLPSWEAAPEAEASKKVEKTLVRYFGRMAGRATPFGLFAGHSVGLINASARLQVSGRDRIHRHTRLDMDYVCALIERVRQEPSVVRELRYVPNSTLYRIGGHWRYLELRSRGRDRSYGLVAVVGTSYLEATLQQSRGGCSLDELVQALVETHEGVTREDAGAYVEALIQSHLLVPTWAPQLTGREPIPALLDTSHGIPALSHFRDQLTLVQSKLAALDRECGGHTEAPYLEIARLLEPLPIPVTLPRLFQVDMFRPPDEAMLSPSVVQSFLHGVRVLQRISPRAVDTPLERFKQKFLERYEGRPTPLLEVLDEEDGIGFVTDGRTSTAAAPLLEGFVFPLRGVKERSEWSLQREHLFRLLERAARTGSQEIQLTEADIEALAARQPGVLPEAFAAMGAVAATSQEALARGDFRVLLLHVNGPSGARFLGRFCHGDAALEARVRQHLRDEEALHPEAVFAEIVHMHQGRVGNVTCRPALRRHDLVFMGQSGVPEQDRIELSDLWLGIEGDRLILRSKRLGKQVIPRLSNAHAYFSYGLGIYRFLGALQDQPWQGFQFQWGALDAARFLPRVSQGRVVLSLARWNLTARELKALGEAPEGGRFDAVNRLREETRMPRWVCLVEGDNRLVVDLDNVLCVEMLVQSIKGRTRVSLEEMFPGPDELCAEGAEGRYVHELLIPFVRESAFEDFASGAPAVAQADAPALTRRFPPGSEWLFFKLYLGVGTADRLLRTLLREELRRLKTTGAIRHWFFMRYKDPDFHLRLRLQGEPSRLLTEVWPSLHAALEPFLANGGIRRIQLDTYEREVERYGGAPGMALSEIVFAADSEAVVDILNAYPGDSGTDLRWRLGLKGVDCLLTDLGQTLDARIAILERLRAGFGAEFQVKKDFEEQLSKRFRKERPVLEALRLADASQQGPWRPALSAFQRRSEQLRPVAEALGRGMQEDAFGLSVGEMIDSYLHMHVNRMLPDEHRPQELILYDFLLRLYRSAQAREGGV
ncbi:lantibiotic dehydratase [Myxococcus qinghaiensis]|uniref:lantibiotic dehydratase n=1 Tax=Myxococcus qinghaiensis TaxID=2906758 RepID=UPI0020A7BAA2|nr:lantibiotic dehydratase [Myxococcus qinghaiensis]MCP3164276.1 lantibiotic dehydratase [Myxococcus qinghaiensis]